jgi:flavin reductase (DIM6/NTAB) family NADH-FMN oxidoreductase RutF
VRFDFAELSAAERYKLLGGLVVPRPIALVTSQSPGGRVNAAPFSFFNVFAEEPPVVVLGLGNSPLGGAKDTTVNIRDGGEFVVHLVDEPIAEAMNRARSTSRRRSARSTRRASTSSRAMRSRRRASARRP